MTSNDKEAHHTRSTSEINSSSANTNISNDWFESPTDLLYRILERPLIFNAEGGPLPKSPYPIPVLTPRQYYSLTKVERADYHLIQQVFNGKIELPKLEQSPVGWLSMDNVVTYGHGCGVESGNISESTVGTNPRIKELIHMATKSIDEKNSEVDNDHDLPTPKLQLALGVYDDELISGSDHDPDGVVKRSREEVYEKISKRNQLVRDSDTDSKK